MWAEYLFNKLAKQRSLIRDSISYYEGNHRTLAFSQEKHTTQFGKIFSNWRDNFCGLIIDSVNERMSIQGFRMGDGADADKDALDIWQRNFMDAESNAAHIDAMVGGAAYAIVWGDVDGQPVISMESAWDVVIQYKPGSRRDIEAGAKFYTDDWGRDWVTLWWQGSVFTFAKGSFGWQGDPSVAPNPLDEVPIVPLNNRSRLIEWPESDLRNVIPLQDAINKTVSDALVASEFAAWPQRYVTGLEIQTDANGNPIEPYNAAIDKLLQAEDPGVKFGQFAAADLSNYTALIEVLVQHMASTSRIPFHYFLNNGGVAPSGESITAAEAGLIAKTRERMLHFGSAWESVMRMCFKVLGDPRSEDWSAETIWSDPENRTEAQHVDALLKLKQLGLPQDQALSDANYTPQQIARFKDMRAQDAKDAMELAQKYPLPIPQPPTPPDENKPPAGNSGNANRKTVDPVKV